MNIYPETKSISEIFPIETQLNIIFQLTKEITAGVILILKNYIMM